MTSISSTAASSQSYATSSAGRSQARQSPAERLEQSLTSFLDEQGVSSDDQTAIKSELSDAVAELASSGSQVSPSDVKSALSEILSSRGLDGESFVSQLGTPGSGGGQGQGVEGGSGRGPRGAGGPPPGGGPPPSDETSETSSTSELTDIEALMELLEEQSSESGSVGQNSQADIFPGIYIKRGGGNLDATA
ncbi:hypothetical protein [Rhodopirellula sallentina]|uniref:Secreted protein n=1 Tax=Rhodopirellula sallentina SM41 TaxID=1263870 RepID=M5UIP0_9BACT|nr:hypothetical protein [Rhodopirellula sallentina]EMI55898.1 secreted protein [Rhodopirellula sallentina SM41]